MIILNTFIQRSEINILKLINSIHIILEDKIIKDIYLDENIKVDQSEYSKKIINEKEIEQINTILKTYKSYVEDSNDSFLEGLTQSVKSSKIIQIVNKI
jgi:hypothetical protein